MFGVNLDQLFTQNPKPILQYRKDAIQNYTQIPFPNIGKLKQDEFLNESLKLQNTVLTRDTEIPVEVKSFIQDDTDNVIIIKDGNVIYENLTHGFEDIYINDLNSAFDERPEVVTELFKNEAKRLRMNQMTAINSAFYTSGVLIYVPKNVQSKEPIKLYNLQGNADFVHRTFVVVDKHSEVNVQEFFTNRTECYANVVSDFYIAENAKVNLTSIDYFTEAAKSYIGLRARVERDGKFNIVKSFLSKSNTIAEINVDLVGEYAEVDVATIGVSDKQQKMNINIDTWNNAKYTSSNIQNYGVALERSTLIFNNAGKIEMGMNGSKAYQSTKGIVLDPKATVQANPFLLIDEFDVEAGHGATIGAFDTETMFYLMSRGLAKSEAEAMIVSGFMKPILATIKNDTMKTQVSKIIDTKMGAY